ncbi:hypothetical protein HHK36_030569 [Tetracentron sinense]|uniref:Uncharacterized protein n=1 Tax=Tetracentron sinense TaxID=13715 RepID=A0A834Y7Y2_TETSI|nr:hypothetical protein HHK36_030569 [Tetracentron sinense]
MCVVKVANQRKTGEFVGFPTIRDDDRDTNEAEGPSQTRLPPPPPQQQGFVTVSAAPMFSGYSTTREMSAMVSALTQVVSGETTGDWVYRSEYNTPVTSNQASGSCSSPPSSSYSSSSASWGGGQKRVREEESGGQLSESALRVHRGFGDFRTSQGESSSGAPG